MINVCFHVNPPPGHKTLNLRSIRIVYLYLVRRYYRLHWIDYRCGAWRLPRCPNLEFSGSCAVHKMGSTSSNLSAAIVGERDVATVVR